MRKLMNRKGSFLEDNFVGIIIGIVCVLLIAGLVVKLAFFFIDQDSKNAQKSLDSLMGKVDALENNENNEFLIRGVDGWYFVGFDLSDSDRPDKCFFNSCVCVCDDPKNCQENGLCREVNFENVEVKSYVESLSGVPSVPTIKESYSYFGNMSCIYLENKLFNIIVSKNQGNLTIFYPGDEDLNNKGRAYLCIDFS